MEPEVANFAEHIFGVIPVTVELEDVAIVSQKLLQGINSLVRSKFLIIYLMYFLIWVKNFFGFEIFWVIKTFDLP